MFSILYKFSQVQRLLLTPVFSILSSKLPAHPPAMRSRDKHKTKTQQTEPKTLIFLVKGECATPIFFSHIPGLPISHALLWHSHCLSEDGWRKAEGRGGDRRGKGRGWMCCSVLLNVLTCMKEEAFILGLRVGVHKFETHMHAQARTHTHARAHTHIDWGSESSQAQR